MRVRTGDLGGIRVLDCEGSLMLGSGADELPDQFAREIAGAGRGVVMDLTRLTYLDSAGVGALVTCSKHAADSGIVLKLALARTGPVRRIFEVTQLERGFEIFEDAESAAASFS